MKNKKHDFESDQHLRWLHSMGYLMYEQKGVLRMRSVWICGSFVEWISCTPFPMWWQNGHVYIYGFCCRAIGVLLYGCFLDSNRVRDSWWSAMCVRWTGDEDAMRSWCWNQLMVGLMMDDYLSYMIDHISVCSLKFSISACNMILSSPLSNLYCHYKLQMHFVINSKQVTNYGTYKQSSSWKVFPKQ